MSVEVDREQPRITRVEAQNGAMTMEATPSRGVKMVISPLDATLGPLVDIEWGWVDIHRWCQAVVEMCEVEMANWPKEY